MGLAVFSNSSHPTRHHDFISDTISRKFLHNKNAQTVLLQKLSVTHNPKSCLQGMTGPAYIPRMFHRSYTQLLSPLTGSQRLPRLHIFVLIGPDCWECDIHSAPHPHP